MSGVRQEHLVVLARAELAAAMTALGAPGGPEREVWRLLYIQTTRVVTWGGPPLWPTAVGAVAIITICALGFT